MVINEIWWPGWKARVDGVSVPVEPAEGALLGIETGPGSHEVELDYAPTSLTVGLWLSLFAWLLWVVFVLIVWKRSGRIAASPQ